MLSLRFNWFVQADDTLYLVDQLQALGVIELLKKKSQFLIHANKYREFKLQLLDKAGRYDPSLAMNIYRKQRLCNWSSRGFNNSPQRIIYLSDLKNYVMIIPVVRYAEVEIPIRTLRQVHATDERERNSW